MDALAIDFASLGALIGLYMLPGIAIALPGGMLGQRFGAKRVVLAGLALMAIGGVVMGLSTSFAAAAAGRLISGTGAVLLTVLVAKIVTAMAIAIASWPFGLAVGLVVYGPLAERVGWSAIMHLGALSAFAAFVLIALIYREPSGTPAAASARFALNLTRREWLLVLTAGAMWGIYNVAYIVLISFAPELFTVRGWSFAEASSIVSLIGWVLIPSVPISGFLIERFGRPTLFMIAAFAITSAALIVLPFTDVPLAAFVVVALAIGVPAGLIMALPAQVMRPESRGSGMGVFFTCYFVAMAILPGAAGLMRDISGSPATPALFAAAMVLLCMLALALFRAVAPAKET
jgi:predicted MFS family arabinose efflux permease